MTGRIGFHASHEPPPLDEEWDPRDAGRVWTLAFLLGLVAREAGVWGRIALHLPEARRELTAAIADAHACGDRRLRDFQKGRIDVVNVLEESMRPSPEEGMTG